DNPDQRISEDINMFIERTLTMSVGLLSAIVTLFSFVTILWMLSAAAPLQLFGSSFAIPGYLVWAALFYATVGTTLTHLIGWPLVSLIFPFVVISPAYFAGAVQLGGLMQTASAFTSVQTALSFFVNAYRQLADWRAVIARLDGFNIAVERAQAAATARPAIEVSTRETAD